MKKCAHCSEIKEDSDFYNHKQITKKGIVRHYLAGSCKICYNLKGKDPEVIDKIAAIRHEKNKTVYGKYMNFKQTRRVREFGNLSFEKFEQLFTEKCCYCQKDRPMGSLTLKDMNGKFDEDNVIPACKSCVIRKSRMEIGKFIRRTGRLYGKTPEQIEIEESFIGQRFNMLVITAISNRKKSAGRIYYTCLCDCGATKDIRIDALTSGDTKSCGCSRGRREGSKNKINNIKSIKSLSSTNKEPYENYFSKIKYSANGRNIEFALDIIDYKKNYYNKNCYYCNAINCTSLDRIDSSKGYLHDNIVSCCKICNSMKNTLSQNDFISHIKQIIDHYKDQEVGGVS